MRQTFLGFMGALLLLTGVALPIPALAVSAAPGALNLVQPDGSLVTVRQWGNEHQHGYETLSGRSVLRDPVSQHWSYAMAGLDGRAVSSGVRVTDGIGQADVERSFEVHLERRLSRLARAQARLRASSSSSTALPAPAAAAVTGTNSAALQAAPVLPVAITGTANVPVLLVNFSDTVTTNTTADFKSLLFGSGNFSMADFYLENSYQRFTVASGPGGIGGWYTALYPHNYYGANTVYGSDAWPADLVHEAVVAADAAGYDFSAYDRDGDCRVDTVAIVHQGTGEEASPNAFDIWSHSWELSAAYLNSVSHYPAYTTNDVCPSNPAVMMTVDHYIIQPERYLNGMSTVGVFTHEFGHVLGLPDLYDTDGSSEGIGNWSLMASGCWNGILRGGDRPAHLDAWSKFFLGWVTPTPVIGTLPNEAISAANSASDVYQFMTGSPTAGGEYFLLENRNKAGFDAGVPGSGLLVWHVDESRATSDNTDNAFECYPGGPSCAAQHYRVALVQADNLWGLEKNVNRGDTGDSFPGASKKISLTDTTLPKSSLYSGALSNVVVTAISAAGPTMTATLADGSISNSRTALTVSNATPTYGTVLTLSAAVKGNVVAGMLPTGTIGFYLDGAATALGARAVSKAGAAGMAIWAPPAGVHTVVAQYSGDSHNYPSASSPATTITVAKAAQAAITLTASPATLTVGASTKFTVAGGSGTGALTLSATGTGKTVCVLVGKVMKATVGVGSCIVTATRAESANYNAASSAPLTVPVN